jgi:hypothetical protein
MEVSCEDEAATASSVAARASTAVKPTYYTAQRESTVLLGSPRPRTGAACPPPVVLQRTGFATNTPRRPINSSQALSRTIQLPRDISREQIHIDQTRAWDADSAGPLAAPPMAPSPLQCSPPGATPTSPLRTPRAEADLQKWRAAAAQQHAHGPEVRVPLTQGRSHEPRPLPPVLFHYALIALRRRGRSCCERTAFGSTRRRRDCVSKRWARCTQS